MPKNPDNFTSIEIFQKSNWINQTTWSTTSCY